MGQEPGQQAEPEQAVLIGLGLLGMVMHIGPEQTCSYRGKKLRLHSTHLTYSTLW